MFHARRDFGEGQGVVVSKRTVSRYLQDQSGDPASGPSWLAFLRNHREAIAAMDLFTVPTVSSDCSTCSS